MKSTEAVFACLFPLSLSNVHTQAWYLGFGAKDVLLQSCKDLPQKIKVFLDGVPQKLPDLEGVVILNINSWSAGCSVWSSESTKDNFTPSR